MTCEAFSKKGNVWSIDTKKPFFQEEQIKRQRSHAADNQKAKPRAVWAAMFPRGIQSEIMEALCSYSVFVL